MLATIDTIFVNEKIFRIYSFKEEYCGTPLKITSRGGAVKKSKKVHNFYYFN